MSVTTKPEVWLRGPVNNIPALLQPVAHALMQAREEVIQLMMGFPQQYLWEKPAGLASVGFHLQHLRGVIDRLFTYANGDLLSEEQLNALRAEGISTDIPVQNLVDAFSIQVDKALDYLSNVHELTLTEKRGVGRSQVPSTVIGLLFHAAEHTQRHLGQLLVTSRVVSRSQP